MGDAINVPPEFQNEEEGAAFWVDRIEGQIHMSIDDDDALSLYILDPEAARSLGEALIRAAEEAEQ